MEEHFMACCSNMGGFEMFACTYVLYDANLSGDVFYRCLETVVSDCTERSLAQDVGMSVDIDCWRSYSCSRRMGTAIYAGKNPSFFTEIQ